MTSEEITQIACDVGDEIHAALPEEVTYALVILAKQGGGIAYCSKVHPKSMLKTLRDVLIPELERAVREGDASDDEHPHVHEWIATQNPSKGESVLKCRFCPAAFVDCLESRKARP